MDVILLSNSKDRIEIVRTVLKRKGLGCVVVADEQGVSAAIRKRSEGILVIDSEATGRLRQLLENRSPGWAILVLTGKFDSSAWVEIFKAGASEVIGDPLRPAKVDAALDGLIGEPERSPQIQTIWSALASRFGFGKGRQG